MFPKIEVNSMAKTTETENKKHLFSSNATAREIYDKLLKPLNVSAKHFDHRSR